MQGLAVGVASQLPEVGEPRIRPLDRPAQPHRLVRLRLCSAAPTFLGDDGVAEMAFGEALAGDA